MTAEPGTIISGEFKFVTLPKQMANGWKYRLYKDVTFATGIIPLLPFSHEFIRYEKNGNITLKRGYQWDGASGGCPDHPAIMRPSLLHDALCQMFAMGIITKPQREQADYLLACMTKKNMLELAAKVRNPVFRFFRKVWAHVWPGCVWCAVRGYTRLTQ